MPATGGDYQEKAKVTLERLAKLPSKDDAVAATVGLGFAVLAVLDELHAIGERAFPASSPTKGVRGFRVES